MDEDDKVRRNLVVFSAGVLLVAWLNVPVQGMLQDALKVKQEVEPARTWLAAAAILVYLILRYRFSPDARKLGKDMYGHFSGVAYNRVNALAQPEAKRAFTGQVPSRFFGKEMQASQEDFANKYRRDPAVRYSVTADSGKSTGLWTGTVITNIYQEADSQIHLIAYEIPFRIDGWPMAKIAARAFWLSWVYSDTSVNRLAPVLLASAAYVVILWKVALSL